MSFEIVFLMSRLRPFFCRRAPTPYFRVQQHQKGEKNCYRYSGQVFFLLPCIRLTEVSSAACWRIDVFRWTWYYITY